MDDIDRLLLRQLQRDADRTLDELGEAVGLSASAVQRRITRLKADGVIRGLVAQLDPRQVGLPITVVTTARVERDSHEHTAPLVERLRRRPEVVLLHVLAGQHDLLVVTVVGELEHYTSGVLADLEDDANVARLETNVSLGVLKSTHELPI
jgi:DNA-binding Lrp family transcriptional regulator